MKTILVCKEWIKSLYAKYSYVIVFGLKFLLTFIALLQLNHYLGYMATLTNGLVVFGISFICEYLPYGLIAFVLSMVLIGHTWAVSLEVSVLLGIVILLVGLLYYSFQPRDGFWLILTPMAFLLNIPYVIPILVGLSGGIVAVVPVSTGVVIYYIMNYVKQNVGVLTNNTEVDITQRYVQLLEAILGNQDMLIMMILVFVCILCVSLLRNLSIDYAWVIAIVCGGIMELVILFLGGFMLDVTFASGQVILGFSISMIIAFLYYLLVFTVDYTRTEYLQYEDDDYVYYVKAVPKATISKTEVTVRAMNHPQKAKEKQRK